MQRFRPMFQPLVHGVMRQGVQQVKTPVSIRCFGEQAATFLSTEEVQERVISVVSKFDKVDASKVTAESHFINDLGLDSLDTVEVVMAFEEEFVIDIPDQVADKILTCQEAVDFIAAHPQAK